MKGAKAFLFAKHFVKALQCGKWHELSGPIGVPNGAVGMGPGIACFCRFLRRRVFLCVVHGFLQFARKSMGWTKDSKGFALTYA